MKFVALIGLAVGCVAAGAVNAQDTEFKPDVLTVETSIAPGRNLFVMLPSASGASTIEVLGADDFAIKGSLPPGTFPQMVLAHDSSRLFTASTYARRIVFGPTSSIVHEWDVNHLTLKTETEIPDKMAEFFHASSMISISRDDAMLFVQNATPATSVSVVDTKDAKLIAEVPTPGCWTVMPAPNDATRFSTVCGDGTLESFTVSPDGKFSTPVRSDKFFDVEADAVFTGPARAGHTLIFPTFKGKLLVVDDSEPKAKLVKTIDMVSGVPGDWAPGGMEVIAYNAPTNDAFVLMHSGAVEGSHKKPAEEIWTVDMTTGKVIFRSRAAGETQIIASQDPKPVLYLTDHFVVNRYDVIPEDKFTPVALTNTASGFGYLNRLELSDD